MRVAFMGTGEIGLPAFRWLLASPECEVVAAVTQPDKPAGRKLELRASAIKQLALEHGVPIFQPVKMRAPEAVAEIVTLRADVIVVMAYGQILPKAVLEAARLACLNLHASLLPRWRGAAPIQAAIEAGDRISGVTVMYVDEGIDTGDILLMKETKIQDTDTGGALHDRLGLLAAEALSEALPLLAAGRAPRVPQDETLATYAPKLTRQSGLIDWKAPAEEIDRHIRAMYPRPGAYTFLPTADGPRQLKVFACVLPVSYPAESGKVIRVDGNGILVGASDDIDGVGPQVDRVGHYAVLLTKLQIEGKRCMTARNFLLGHRVEVGTVLGGQ